MKWSKKVPNVTGWWMVGHWRGKVFHHNLIEVREHWKSMEWSFLNGLTWNNVGDYPHYWWAGPIKTPKLPKRP